MSHIIIEDQTVNDYQKLIAKEVWSYIRRTDNSNLEADNLIQDLWVEILEYRNAHGKLPDYALAKKICQSALVDITRKGVRRNHVSMNTDTEGDRADWEIDHKSTNNFISEVEVDELLNTYPKGSKERTYIEFYLTKAGIRHLVDLPDGAHKGGYTDSALSRMLGYYGTGDRAWKVFSREMKKVISDYFGYQQ